MAGGENDGDCEISYLCPAWYLALAFRLPFRALLPALFFMITYYHTDLIYLQIAHEIRRCLIIRKIATRKDVKTNHIMLELGVALETTAFMAW